MHTSLLVVPRRVHGFILLAGNVMNVIWAWLFSGKRCRGLWPIVVVLFEAHSFLKTSVTFDRHILVRHLLIPLPASTSTGTRILGRNCLTQAHGFGL